MWVLRRSIKAVIASHRSRECAPDEAKQSMGWQERMDCFVASAPRNDDFGV
jgi:hypothetical protein